MRLYWFLLMIVGVDALADNATVGNGSPASCTTVAFNNAVAALDLGQAPGGTLSFNCGPNPHTIMVNGQSFLNSQTTVDGGGRITLDGNNLHRIFVVAPRSPGDQTEVTIRGITLLRGFAAGDFGGAILGAEGVSVALDGVTINDSRAGLSGGAVAMAPGSLLNVFRSNFRNNTGNDGGAIATSAATVIEDSNFVLNTASVQGGAIQSWVAQLTVRRSGFVFNLAERGGAIYKRNAPLIVEDSRLRDNTAAIDGGAIYAEADAMQVNAYGSTFEGNIATQGSGGGIRSLTDVVLALCTFHNNRAQVGGGVSLSGAFLPTLDDCTFSENFAQLRGGAIDVVNVTSRVKMFQITMSNNSVQNGPGGDLALQDALGEVELSSLIGGNASAGAGSIFVGSGASAILRGSAIWVAAGSACIISTPGTMTSGGNNVGTSAGCALNHASDVNITTFAGLGLGEFGDYGGNHRGYLPLPGSVLIDRFSCAGSDMRLKPRPIDGDSNGSALCDSGAMERQPIEPGLALFRSSFE
jgi:predicted outer membrane repeat protein